MYVVLDRALPHVYDGLKPVQRRILYVMHLLGLTSKAKYKKSTRTVGDALGKFHPHGDRACYEAMVILAQWFNTRHPLIDGQGNWGSLDNPHSFAAMRYTEARLTAFAQSYLDEIQSGGVPWIANFDGTLKEPVVLPSQLPHVLLNGAYGIAVGMTTNIPPHNCREVVDACLLLLDDPDATDDALMQAVPGPDFPTGGECINTKESLRVMYLQGEGALTLRATYHLEDQLFVVDQLPYRVSPTKVLTQIAEAMQQKKLPQVVDLRDESDHEVAVRIVLEMKSKRTDANELAMLLFAMTDMEKQDRAIFNAISPERAPELYSLRKLLSTWLGQRKHVVVERSKKRLEQVLDTIHILEGLLIVYLNLDDVIALIREHESPSPELQSRFSLSERQAEAILEIKLRALSKLQDIALMQQKKELEEERDYLQGIIGDSSKLTALVKDELKTASERYQSPRRTQLVTREPASLAAVQDQMQPAQNEPLTLVLSEQGWGRIAKGHVDASGASFRVGDKLQGVYHGHSAHRIMLASADGRFFTITPESLPSIRTQGAPLSQFLDIGPSVRLPYVFWQENEQEKLLLISNEGYGFYALYGDLLSKIKSGKQVMTGRSEDYSMLPPRLGWMNHTHLALVSAMGRMLVVSVSELAYLKKGKGQKLMGLAEDDCLALCCTLNASDSIKLGAGRRTFTMKPDVWAGYVGGRGRKGKWLPKGFVQVASLEAKS